MDILTIKRGFIVLFFLLLAFFAITAKDPFWAGKLVPITSILLIFLIALDAVSRNVDRK